MQFTSPNDLHVWLHNLNVAFETGELRCPRFLKPFHLVTLALMMKRHQAWDLELPEDIHHYAVRMNVWEAAGIQPPYDVSRHETQNRFIPVEPLQDKSNCDQISRKLSKLIQATGQNQITYDPLRLYEPIFELVSNTYAHAAIHEALYGLVCAQSWPKGNLVQIAFADIGIGIRESLTANVDLESQLAQQNACALACQYGITSKPSHHSGYGLSLANELMKNHAGNLQVYSVDELYSSGVIDAQETLPFPYWQGTLIVLEWPLDQALDVLKVYNQWPISSGFEREDFFDA